MSKAGPAAGPQALSSHRVKPVKDRGSEVQLLARLALALLTRAKASAVKSSFSNRNFEFGAGRAL